MNGVIDDAARKRVRTMPLEVGRVWAAGAGGVHSDWAGGLWPRAVTAWQDTRQPLSFGFPSTRSCLGTPFL